MTVERHLTLQELTLRPSGEWSPRGQGWIVAHVVEGSGYWLHAGHARELNPGDGFVVATGTPAVVRASQLGQLKLQFFSVLPQYLNGLLTVGEGRQLETGSTKSGTVAVVFNAAEPLGQKFKHIAQLPANDSLALRCALLQLWSGAVAGLLQTGPAGSSGNKLRERFREFIGHMSEAELASRSLPDLAREMHCSERHFSRLFREEFGEPLRSRQIELRLQRAHRLLVDSEDKIIHIAFESGYRHLGLFNAMFKKRFGVTPSEWRHQNDKGTAPEKKTSDRSTTTGRLALTAVFWFTLCTWLLAWPAGAQTNQVSKARGFTVKKYVVSGNTILPPETIARALTNSPESFGTNVTLDGLRAALADLQLAYRERGYVTVAVGLPQQKLTNETVKIQVTEGRLASVRVTGNRYFSSNNVMAALPSLHTNILLNSHIFQRELDLANANRDRQIYPVISPGLEPGTSDLTLKVKDRLPWHVRLEINNQAPPGTPDLRSSFSSQYNNLWNLEHQVGLQYSYAVDQFKNDNVYNLSPFDAPAVASYSGYYRMPIGGLTPVEQQLDASPGNYGYNESTHKFVLPPASTRPELSVYASRSTADTGVKFSNAHNVASTPLLTIDSIDSGENITLNEGLGAKVSLPLRQLFNLSSTFSFGLDFKRYALTSNNTNNFPTGFVFTNQYGPYTNSHTISSAQPTARATLDYLPFNLGWGGSAPDRWGTTFFNVQGNFNLLPGFAHDGDFAKASYTTNARAQYVTVQMSANRVQKIYHDWDVLLRADGQWANTPLFSNEQYAMGGNAGVRGYGEAESYGDSGWRVAVEPRTPLIDVGMVDGNVPMWLRSSVFLDYGETYLLESQASSVNRLQFLGTGWTLTANIGDHLDARLTVGCPLIGNAQTHSGDIHIYFGVGAQF